MREPELSEAPFDYEHSKAMTDFFLKAMDVQYQPLEDGQEVPSLADIWQAHLSGDVNPLPEPLDDINGIEHLPGEVAPEERLSQGLPDLDTMTDALGQLRQVLPGDHTDILRLETAIEMVRYHGVTPDISEPEVGPGYAPMEQVAGGYEQDMFEQQAAVFEHQTHALEEIVDVFGTDAMPALDAPLEPDRGLESMIGECNDGYAELGGLEQRMEQEQLFEAIPAEPMAEVMPADIPRIGMADPLAAVGGLDYMTPEDEIAQGIDALAGQPGMQEMEPDPFQVQHDPFATAQQIFDQQMQFMANPFLMPGMMPMGPAPGM
jgi:hypothetical protein